MYLSNTTLKEFEACPHCFYLDKKLNIKKPPPIIAGVLNAIDRAMKDQFDDFRVQGGPPKHATVELPKGWVLFSSQVALKKMRHWKSGLQYENAKGFTLIGALDDLMFNPATGLYMPLDYKSKGKATDEASTEKFYQLQGDIYSLLLEENGYQTTGKAMFVYYRPSEIDPANEMLWECQAIQIDADKERARDVFDRASACLLSPNAPKQSDDCAMCQYVEARQKL